MRKGYCTFYCLLITLITFSQTVQPSGPTGFCPGGSVTLSVSGANNGTSFQWLRDNVIMPAQTSLNLTVNTAGKYTVITTLGNKADTLNEVIVTAYSQPTPDFSFDNNNVCSGTALKFTSNITNGKAPYTYEWDFGDGNSSTTNSPTHRFVSEGCDNETFKVTLKVTDANGCSGSISKDITVKQLPNVSIRDEDIFSPFSNCDNNPTKENPDFELTILNNSINASCITSYRIDWGDGTIQNNVSFPLKHKYTTLGAFELKVTATGRNGCTNTKTYTVANQSNPAGSLGTLGATQNLCAPATVPFTITNWQLNSPGTIYRIDYGDGTVETFTHPLNPNFTTDTIYHTYTKTSCPSPSFTANLTVINACASTPYSAGNIQIRIKPSAGFDAPLTGCVNKDICFSNTTIAGNYGTDCNNATLYKWDFGDGNTSTAASPCHKFTKTGTYTVTLSATNPCGTTTFTKTICIVAPPTPDFTLDKMEGCGPLTVKVQNTSSTLTDCTPATYRWAVGFTATNCNNTEEWVFENATNENSTEPIINFKKPGKYTITLSVTNGCGTATTKKEVLVKAPPTVSISVLQNSCGPITFKPKATITNCGTGQLSFRWVIDNGTPITTQDPGELSFTTSGLHTISLTVSNECGSTTDTKTFTVNPLPELTIPQNLSFCSGQVSGPITFSSQTPGAVTRWSASSNYSVIGLSSISGNGPIPSFTTKNTTSSPITVTITVTATVNGCQRESSFTITVNPLPAAPAVTAKSYCKDELAQDLTATFLSGHTLRWYTVSSGGTPSDEAPTPSTATVGTTAYYVSQVNTVTGCESPRAALAVTVRPIPAIMGTANNPAACGAANGSIVISGLTANTLYSVSYSKNGTPATTFHATATVSGTINISGLAAGTYTDVAVTLNGCRSNLIGPFVLTDPSAPAMPTATASGSVCSGNPINLSTAAVTGATYTWTGPNNYISSQRTPTINNAQVTHSGKYFVTVTVAGCTSPSGSVDVVVDPSPAIPAVSSNSPICSGDQLQLNAISATPGVSYTWSGPNNFTETVQNPSVANITMAASGSYTLVTRLGNCLSQPASLNVVVNPTPVISGSSAQNPTACGANNGTITLTGVAPGIYTLRYFYNGSLVNLPNQSVGSDGSLRINNLSAGNYSTITLSRNGCSSNAIGPFDLKDPNPPSAPTITSNSPVCSGTTIQLTASSSGGATYVWTGPGGVVSNTTTVTIPNATAANAGTYTVSATSSGCSVSASTNVVVNAAPLIPAVTSPVVYCHNEPAIALNASGTNLTWFSLSDTSDASSNAPVPSTATTGNQSYYVWQTNSAGCRSAVAVIQVTVLPAIGGNTIGSNQTICEGGQPNALEPSETIKGGNGSYNYQWQVSTNGGNDWSDIVGATNVSYSPGSLSENTYYRRLAGSSNCRDTSNTVAITVQGSIINTGIGSPQVICSGTKPAAIEGQQPSGGSGTYQYNWESSPDGITWTPIVGETGQNYQPPVLATSMYYRRKVSSGQCAVYSSSTLITVNPVPRLQPVADLIVCNNSATGAIAFSATPSTGVSYRWTNDNPLIGLAPSGTGSITSFLAQNNNSTPAVARISVTPVFTGNGVECAGAPITFRIVVLPTPTIAAIPPVEACTGSTVDAYSPVPDLTPVAGATLSYAWTVSGNGINLANGNGSQIPEFSTQNSGTTDQVATITVTPRYTYSNRTCEGPSVSYTVTVKPTTPPANAGPDGVLCAATTYTMQAIAVSGTSGNWTQIEGPLAEIVSPASPASVIRNLHVGSIYKFVWTQSGFAGCLPTTDTVTIDNKEPLVNEIETETQIICSGQRVTVAGKLPLGGNGTRFTYQWESSADGQNFSPINGATGQNFSFIPTSTVYLRRYVESAPCTGFSDIVMIVVQAALSNNTIAADAAICTGTAAPVIIGSLPTGGNNQFNYSWEKSTDGGAMWTTLLADTKDLQPGVLTQTTLFRRIVTTALCSGDFASISNVITVTVNPDAKAVFQPSTTVQCAPFAITPAVINLQPSPANSQYLWYADDSLIGNGQAFPGYTITGENDSVTIKLKVLSAFGCKSDSLSYQFKTPKTPSPSFTLSEAVGCGPLTVNITNTSTYINEFTYAWDFGNGQTSTAVQPPAITFAPNPQSGDTTYTITLHVFSPCDTLSFTRSVRVKSAPKALFTPVKTIGCSPMQAVFRNHSKGLNNTYHWDFGDGTTFSTTSTDSVTHTYNVGRVDTFYVKLVAENECGRDSIRYAIVVSPNTVKLNFAVNGTEHFGCTPHSVAFINNTSGASTFQWNFGDGNILSTTKNIDTVYHTYQSPGRYAVQIRAFNSCSDTTATEYITVYPKPKAAFSVDKNAACIGDSLHFTNLSDSATSYRWHFGDGRTSTVVNPAHRYNNPGMYTVRLIIYRNNPSGNICIDSVDQQVEISASLQGSFTTTDLVGQCAPFTVTFVNGNRPSVTTTWDFGDGTTGRGDSVVHTYAAFGTYTVSLTTTVPGGCTYTSQKTVRVLGPGGSLRYTGGFTCLPNTVQLQAVASNTDSYVWDFGDGTVLTTTAQTVYHQYKEPGLYLPSVTLKNNAGCAFPLKGVDTIRVDRILAGFTTAQQTSCGSTFVSFRDTSKVFFGKASVKWVFGDGTTGDGFSATHQYRASGTYPVEMIVYSNSGCSDTVRKALTVQVNSQPVATITASAEGCTGRDIVFTSNVQASDAIGLRQWTLSNGATASGPQFTYRFLNPGTYTLQFIAGTIYGCYDTTTHTITINPSPDVTVSAGGNLCLGSVMPLTASGASSYQWRPLEGLSCYTCPSTLASPKVTTPYVVEGRNSFGCVDYDTAVITVIQPLRMTVSGNDSICIGQSAPLLVSGATNYSWSPAIGLSSTTVSNPIATPQTTTTYRVVGYDGFNCFTDTAFLTVAVGEYPTVDLGPDLSLAAGTQHPLQSVITAGPIRNWLWTPATDLSCATCPLPIANIKKDISYAVKVTTAYGCSAADTVSIRVFCEESSVFIPNAFTPDGDGINDILMVRSKGVQAVKYFRIFNRWGNVVFEKNNFSPNNPLYAWDGRINGVVGGPDVYVYTCEVICENGTSFTYKGNVSIIK